MSKSTYKSLSDNALMRLTKKELIKQIRLVEHEYFIADGALKLRGQVYDAAFADGYLYGQHVLREQLEQSTVGGGVDSDKS